MRKLVLFLHLLLALVFIFFLFVNMKPDGSIPLTFFSVSSFVVSIILLSILSHLSYRSRRREYFYNVQAAAEATHFRNNPPSVKKDRGPTADEADANSTRILSKW